MPRTITERFDDHGNLIERITVETDAQPYVMPPPRPPDLSGDGKSFISVQEPAVTWTGKALWPAGTALVAEFS